MNRAAKNQLQLSELIPGTKGVVGFSFPLTPEEMVRTGLLAIHPSTAVTRLCLWRWVFVCVGGNTGMRWALAQPRGLSKPQTTLHVHRGALALPAKPISGPALHAPKPLAQRTRHTAGPAPSPDHVGVLEGLQVPQDGHLPDGGQRHALLAGLHPHPLQRHEAAAILQVAGLEHLPVGSLADLSHALILLVGQVGAVLVHAAAAPLPPGSGAPHGSSRLCRLLKLAPRCGSATRRYLCPTGSRNPSSAFSAARVPVSLRWQSPEMIIQPLGAWSVRRQLDLEKRPSKREQLEHGAIVLQSTSLPCVA